METCSVLFQIRQVPGVDDAQLCVRIDTDSSCVLEREVWCKKQGPGLIESDEKAVKRSIVSDGEQQSVVRI